jgi:hypothetical protein
MAIVDGQRVQVGDWVCFKCDIEQSGQIQSIQSGGELVLTNPGGFRGDYIGGRTVTTVLASECWIE